MHSKEVSSLLHICEVMCSKEETAAGRKRKQAVMDKLLTPSTKTSVESSLMDTRKSGSKELDAKIASFYYENGIAFNTAA